MVNPSVEAGFAFTTPLFVLGLPLLVGLILSVVMEYLLTPQSRPIWKRPGVSLLLHLGSWLLLYAAELVLFRRPWFAMGNVLAIQLLIVLVNNAKYHAMREPFLVHDFEYFTDAIKHPRLYLPFFGILNALLAFCAFIGVLVAGVILEPSVFSAQAVLAGIGTGQVITVWALLLFAAVVAIAIGFAVRQQALSLIPEQDYQQLGQIGFLWHYGILHFTQPAIPAIDPWLTVLPDEADVEKLPDVVVVQSESFFDARAEYPILKSSVLTEFDQLCESSSCWGALTVPAWGANTIRTESAFLTGKLAADFGVHQFSPYRYFMKQSQRTVAHALRELGYRTVCIHPYPASFYLRDQLYPAMGFDEFIDQKAFSEADKEGQYMGDIAVAERVKSLLNAESSAPLFIFVITMENHGPLHLEKPSPSDQLDFYYDRQPAGCDDLTVYARHLKNADTMAVMLKESLADRANGGVLAWYGDHVPIMTNVYRELGMPKGETRYFVWTDRMHDDVSSTDVSEPALYTATPATQKDISELSGALLRVVSNRYQLMLDS